MSANKHQPHVLVLPEDDANRQIANGFLRKIVPLKQRNIQILREAGGWTHVRDELEKIHNAEMKRYPHRHLVVLVDFDASPTRKEDLTNGMDQAILERVFVLGSLKEPEDIKAALKVSFEKIGRLLATDCQEGKPGTWEHDLLKHNADELKRINATPIKSILF